MSAAVDVLAAVGGIAGVAGPSFVVGWTVGRSPDDDPSTAIAASQRASRYGAIVTGVTTAVVVITVDGIAAIGPALLPRTDVWLLDGIAGLVLSGLVVCYPGRLATHLGWNLHYRNVESSEYYSIGGFAATVSAMYLFVAATVFLVVLLVSAGGPLGTVLVPPGIVFLWIVLSPHTMRWRRGVRALAAAEADAVADALETAELDLDLERVRVIETDPTADLVGATIRGIRGRRHVFVTDALFDAVDEDTLQPFVALLAVDARSWGREYVSIVGSVVFGVVVYTVVRAANTGDPVMGLGTLLVLVVAVPIVWAVVSVPGRRITYRADDRVARRVGSEELAAALEAIASVGQGVPWRVRVLLMTPSVDKRIERLRERAD